MSGRLPCPHLLSRGKRYGFREAKGFEKAKLKPLFKAKSLKKAAFRARVASPEPIARIRGLRVSNEGAVRGPVAFSGRAARLGARGRGGGRGGSDRSGRTPTPARARSHTHRKAHNPARAHKHGRTGGPTDGPGRSLTEALHLVFTLYSEFKASNADVLQPALDI